MDDGVIGVVAALSPLWLSTSSAAMWTMVVLGALIALTDLGDNFGGAVDDFLMHIAAAVIAAAAALWAATWLRSKAVSAPPSAAP